MGIFEELIKCTSYKAVYLYETQSAYIWQDGKCSHYASLEPEQIESLQHLAQLANKRFFIPGKAFGFSS